MPTTEELKRLFPIMDGGELKSLPWTMIQPHEAQALRNHDQTLERLAERSGLSPCEALCVLGNITWPRSWFNGTPPEMQVWTQAVLTQWAQDHATLAAEVIASRTTIEALQARVKELEGQCERSTVIECGWREQVRDMKPKMENAERKLAEITEIASWEQRDKEGYIAQGPGILVRDMRRIATLAKVTS